MVRMRSEAAGTATGPVTSSTAGTIGGGAVIKSGSIPSTNELTASNLSAAVADVVWKFVTNT